MRQIKFRAWAHSSKVMFNPDSDNGWELINGELHPLPNTALMQFTGLQDKNGVDIYECDVLQIISKYAVRPWSDQPDKKRYYKEPKIQNKLVTFNTEKACFEVDGTSFAYAKATNYEVIGNLYENPELLTDNN